VRRKPFGHIDFGRLVALTGFAIGYPVERSLGRPESSRNMGQSSWSAGSTRGFALGPCSKASGGRLMARDFGKPIGRGPVRPHDDALRAAGAPYIVVGNPLAMFLFLIGLALSGHLRSSVLGFFYFLLTGRPPNHRPGGLIRALNAPTSWPGAAARAPRRVIFGVAKRGRTSRPATNRIGWIPGATPGRTAALAEHQRFCCS